MLAKRLRTLIVDDSLVFRKILCDLLKKFEEIEIVGQAPNGKIALAKIVDLKPDLIFLDLDMPEMNGIQVIEELKKMQIQCGIIIVSGASSTMCRVAVKALNSGAFDFISKPVCETIQETMKILEVDLGSKLRAFLLRYNCSIPQVLSRPEKTIQEGFKDSQPTEITKVEKNIKLFAPDLIIIGISTGGPPALTKIFGEIHQPLKTPVIIVQHIPVNFSEALAASIQERSGLVTHQAEEGMPLEENHIYIAPGGRHLALARKKVMNEYVFALSDEPPVNNCRPSIDYLIESAYKNFNGHIALFIMTGMGTDGLNGARLLKSTEKHLIIAQSEESCVVYGMPKAIVEAGLANEILHLNEIPNRLERLGNRKNQSNAGDSLNKTDKTEF
ncbi:MAG: chemotaxis-specific protein-glutamate methyltransferase CheB [Candidatus Riflebacteria bacterium]